MKKLILLIMIAISLISYTSEMNVETYLQYKDQLKTTEGYDEMIIQLDGLIEKINEFVTIDYLDGAIKISRQLCDIMDKPTKEIVLLALVAKVDKATNSTNVNIKVDYTTVLWIINDKIYAKRVY